MEPSWPRGLAGLGSPSPGWLVSSTVGHATSSSPSTNGSMAQAGPRSRGIQATWLWSSALDRGLGDSGCRRGRLGEVLDRWSLGAGGKRRAGQKAGRRQGGGPERPGTGDKPQGCCASLSVGQTKKGPGLEGQCRPWCVTVGGLEGAGLDSPDALTCPPSVRPPPHRVAPPHPVTRQLF